MVVWIMSQNILIHIHGERSARVERCVTLTGIPLCAPAEAAETRAQRLYVFGPPGRGASIVQNIGPRKEHDENGGLNLDVQVQIEQAVMVDYHPRTHRTPRVPNLDRRQNEIEDGETSSANQGQWELSNVAKTRDIV